MNEFPIERVKHIRAREGDLLLVEVDLTGIPHQSQAQFMARVGDKFEVMLEGVNVFVWPKGEIDVSLITPDGEIQKSGDYKRRLLEENINLQNEVAEANIEIAVLRKKLIEAGVYRVGSSVGEALAEMDAEDKTSECQFCHMNYNADNLYTCPSCDTESCTDCGGRCGCEVDDDT